MRASAGSTETCGVLRPTMWAAALDHGQSAARADEGGVAPVRLAHGQGEARPVLGGEDQVDVVGHKTIGPARDVAAAQLRAHQIKIDRLVARLQEDRLAAVAPLGHMVGDTRDDGPRLPGHAKGPRRSLRAQTRRKEAIKQLISCHRNKERFYYEQPIPSFLGIAQ